MRKIVVAAVDESLTLKWNRGLKEAKVAEYKADVRISDNCETSTVASLETTP